MTSYGSLLLLENVKSTVSPTLYFRFPVVSVYGPCIYSGESKNRPSVVSGCSSNCLFPSESVSKLRFIRANVSI